MSDKRSVSLEEAVEAVAAYAIFVVDADGRIASWNAGAARGTGWQADEIVGRDLATLFTPEDRAADRARLELSAATQLGGTRSEIELLRKDGGRFVAEVTLTPVRDAGGRYRGCAIVARDITHRRRGEAAIANLNRQLEERVGELAAANQELEAFSYSVSHDLRAPLRAIDGFAQILSEQYGRALDEKGQHYLERVRAAAQRMGQLIDDLLSLARITRAEVRRAPVDLTQLACEIADELARHEPERQVDLAIAPTEPAEGDVHLLRVVLENLLGNAWKFTRHTAGARIAFGREAHDGVDAYFVRDNGAGFDMAYAGKLFAPFQRLHDPTAFEGSGIGLATVQRIISRHGGRVWAEGRPGQGATFWFTVG